MKGGNEFSAEQRLRFCSSLQLGNVIKYKKRQPPSSIILGLPDQPLNVWIKISNERKEYIEINSSMKVGELQMIIRQKYEVDCEYISFHEKILNPMDKLSDCGVINDRILVVKHNCIARFTVIIKLVEIDSSIFQMEVDQKMDIKRLKKEMSQSINLPRESIRLYLGSEEVKDQFSFADLGIYSDSTLFLKYTSIKGVSRQMPIRLREGLIPIKELNKYHEILLINPDSTHNQSQSKKYLIFQKKAIKNPVRILLSNEVSIQCSQGMYFYSKQDKWKIISPLESEHNRLRIGDEILLAKRTFVAIENIFFSTYSSLIHPIKVSYMVAEGFRAYSVNDIVISPGLGLQIFYHSPEGPILFAVDMHSEMTVRDLKLKIEAKKNIASQLQFLYIQNKQTLLKDNLLISQIYTQNIVVQLTLVQLNVKSKIQLVKIITFTFDDQSKKFIYNQILNQPCQQIIKDSFKSLVEQIPYYGILLNRKLIDPNLKIIEIIKRQSEDFYYENFDFVIIKFPEKIILKSIFDQFRRQHNGNHFESIFSKIKSLFIHQQTVAQKYQRNYRLQDTKNLLKNINRGYFSLQNYEFPYEYISELLIDFQNWKKYFGVCYRAIPYDACQKISKCIIGSIVSFRQFISCSPKKEAVEKLLGNEGVILKIHSINGRQVNQKPQIVFHPFSYFILKKQSRKGDKIQIELLEIPAPLTLSKRIALWIDDNPQNNYKKYYSNIEENTEIVQLTSTAMARQWFNEFGWVINRLNLKMRVVTDMTRKEENINNHEAGIDLIEYLINDCGFTTPVLIYSADVNLGKLRLQARQIRPDRFTQITNYPKNMLKYINFQTNLQE